MANLKGLLGGIFGDMTIHNQDESGATYHYYGYLSGDGKIIIMRAKTDDTEYRYYLSAESDTVNYPGEWAARAAKTYRQITQL